MRSLCIETDRLTFLFADYAFAQQRLKEAATCLQNAQYQLSVIDAEMRFQVNGLLNQTNRIAKTMDSLNRYVIESANVYRRVESRLSKEAAQISDTTGKLPVDISVITGCLDTALHLLKKPRSAHESDQTGAESSKYGKWSLDFVDTYTDTTVKGFTNQSLFSLLYNGVKYQKEAGLHLAKLERTDRFQNFTGSVMAAVGNAEISGEVKGSLFDDHKFDPYLEARLNAEVSAACGKISAEWGNHFFKSRLSAEAEVGVASANAKAVINKNEVTLSAEVGVAAVKAEASQTFDIFGLKLTVTPSAQIGVGYSGNFSASSHSVEIGSSISILFGGGLDFKLEW